MRLTRHAFDPTKLHEVQEREYKDTLSRADSGAVTYGNAGKIDPSTKDMPAAWGKLIDLCNSAFENLEGFLDLVWEAYKVGESVDEEKDIGERDPSSFLRTLTPSGVEKVKQRRRYVEQALAKWKEFDKQAKSVGKSVPRIKMPDWLNDIDTPDSPGTDIIQIWKHQIRENVKELVSDLGYFASDMADIDETTKDGDVFALTTSTVHPDRIATPHAIHNTATTLKEIATILPLANAFIQTNRPHVELARNLFRPERTQPKEKYTAGESGLAKAKKEFNWVKKNLPKGEVPTAWKTWGETLVKLADAHIAAEKRAGNELKKLGVPRALFASDYGIRRAPLVAGKRDEYLKWVAKVEKIIPVLNDYANATDKLADHAASFKLPFNPGGQKKRTMYERLMGAVNLARGGAMPDSRIRGVLDNEIKDHLKTKSYEKPGREWELADSISFISGPPLIKFRDYPLRREQRKFADMLVELLPYAWRAAEIKKLVTLPDKEAEPGDVSKLMDRQEVGKVGPWPLYIEWPPEMSIPSHVRRQGDPIMRRAMTEIPYSVNARISVYKDVAKLSYKLLRKAGVSDRVLQGPIYLQFREEIGRFAGFYRWSDNRLIVYADEIGLDDRKKGDVGLSDAAWTLVHEVAHRIYFKGLTPNGRSFWKLFIEKLGKPLTRSERRACFARAVMDPEAKTFTGDKEIAAFKRDRDLSSIDSETAARKVWDSADAKTQWLASTFWNWFSYQKGTRLSDYAEWLKSKNYTRGLTSNYANTTPTEAWPETVANMVLRRGKRKTDPVIADVVRRLLRQVRESRKPKKTKLVITERAFELAEGNSIKYRVRTPSGGIQVGAFAGNKKVGNLVAVERWRSYAIQATKVIPEYQRQGIATRMYELAHEAACKLGKPLLTRGWSRSPEATRVWKKMVATGQARPTKPDEFPHDPDFVMPCESLDEADLKLGQFRAAKSDEVYYWSPSSSAAVKPGMKVPPFKGRWQLPSGEPIKPQTEAERVLEWVRREKFPNLPSRIGSVMLCPTLEGFCGRLRHRRHGVYEVRVTGKVFLTDGGLFSAVSYATSDAQRERRRSDLERADWFAGVARERAENYWRGELVGRRKLPEVLVDGTAVIVRKLSDEELGESLDEARRCLMPSYGGLRGGMEFSAATAYEVNLGRFAEAIHCVLGSIERVSQDARPLRDERAHIDEELRVMESLLDVGAHPERPGFQGSYYSPERLVGRGVSPYEATDARESVQSIQKQAPRLLSKAQKHFQAAPGWFKGFEDAEARTGLVRASYAVAIALAEAALDSVRHWPERMGNAYTDPRLVRAVKTLRGVATRITR